MEEIGWCMVRRDGSQDGRRVLLSTFFSAGSRHLGMVLIPLLSLARSAEIVNRPRVVLRRKTVKLLLPPCCYVTMPSHVGRQTNT